MIVRARCEMRGKSQEDGGGDDLELQRVAEMGDEEDDAERGETNLDKGLGDAVYVAPL